MKQNIPVGCYILFIVALNMGVCCGNTNLCDACRYAGYAPVCDVCVVTVAKNSRNWQDAVDCDFR